MKEILFYWNASVIPCGDFGQVKKMAIPCVTADVQKVVDHLVNGTLSQSLCRICLRPLDEAAESVFTKICKEDHEYSVADIMKNICDIEVAEVDQYHACSNCFLLATTAYKFYLLTKQSDDILNFYVDDIMRNIQGVVVPQNINSESLCIPLPMVNPVEEFYQFNLTDLSKKLETKHFDTEKLNEMKSQNNNVNDKIESKQELNDDEEEIIVVQDSNFYKILKDGSMVELNQAKAEEYQAMFKRSVTSNGEIKKKRKVREKMATIECWLCSQKFRFTAKLKRHLKIDHSVNLFLCTLCPEFYTNELEFNNHLDTHPNIYRCDLCGIILKKRHTLIRHIENHNEINLNPSLARICEVCGTVLKDSDSLKDHMERKHVKQFTCNYCGKMYKTGSSHDKHIKKHEKVMAQAAQGKDVITMKKPESKRSSEFTCTTCGRNCVDQRALLWHTRLHTNERPFKCDECGRGFISLNRRNQHALTAHTEPTKRCPLCPALFHLKSMVNSHIKKVHLRLHKRRARTPRPRGVYWRTSTVPLSDLSVTLHASVRAMQEQLPTMQTKPAEEMEL